MSRQSSSFPTAIQVIRSENKLDSNEDESQSDKTKVKVIKTIKQHKKGGQKLEDVLVNEGFGDLPLLVFSITGKTRGGKSFLLNMMIKYLEGGCESGGEWTTGTVPRCFEWKGGQDSVTRGLWIWPKIYERQASDGSKVGILLLDNEGMFDGEATDGEIIAISGISTAISYLQMFNIKEKITSDCLEGIVRNLAKGVTQINDDEGDKLRDRGYRLMFVVRDWIGEEENYGLEEGKKYILNEKKRGTYEYQTMWCKVEETFSETECLLLPHPGTVALKKQFTDTGELSKLEGEFLREVKVFIETLFSSKQLKRPEVPLTGRDVFGILESADDREADDSLSFLNVYTDHNNWIKTDKLKEDFSQRLTNVQSHNLKEIRDLMIDILAKAEASLSGQSKQDHLDKLTKTIHDLMNNKIIEIVIKKYKSSLLSALSNHKNAWTSISRMMHDYLCGATSATFIQAQGRAVLQAARIYYEVLSKSISNQLEKECKNKTSLECLMGLGKKTMEKFTKCNDFNFGAGTKLTNSAWFMQRQKLKDQVSNIIFKKTGALAKIRDENQLKISARSQYEYFEAFNILNNREWDEVYSKEIIILHKKVGYAMFGLPVASSQSNQLCSHTGENVSEIFTRLTPVTSIMSWVAPLKKSVLETGYTCKQEQKIKPVANKIAALSGGGKIMFSCIFLTFPQEEDKKVPLFRIKGVKDIKYLDTNCRLYSDWENFKTTNTLPDIVYCCPAEGNYNSKDDFFVDFLKSPASTISEKILKYTDVTSKGVGAVAGVAGLLALATTAPVVGPVAVVGGGLTGLYGAVRGGLKIWDKHKHDQEVNKSDYIGVCLNTVSAASMGAGAASVAVEQFAVAATRFAQSLPIFGTVALLFGSGDVPSIDVLLAELADISLKVLFYFNTSSSIDAIEIVKENLGLPIETNSANVLVALAEKNSIESPCDHGELITEEKFVSSNVFTLVADLANVGTKLREVVVLVNDINTTFRSRANGGIDGESVIDIGAAFKICKNMELLNQELLGENEKFIATTISVLSKKACTDKANQMTILMNGLCDKDVELVLTVRKLLWSIISLIRNANRFYNNVKHRPISLDGVVVECHPLEEVTRKIKALCEQPECMTDLSSEVISEVFGLLLEIAKPNWQSVDFAKSLQQILIDVVDMFDSQLSEHKLHLVKENAESSSLDCYSLTTFLKWNGIEGNYGSSLMQKVIANYEHEDNKNEIKQLPDLTIIDAWSGFIDNLYFFHCRSPADCLDLLTKELINNKANKPTTSIHHYRDAVLYELVPCDRKLFETFIIYSFKTNEGLSGFVWKGR